MDAFVFGQVGGDKTRGGILGDKLAKQGGHAIPLSLRCRTWPGVDERLFASSPSVCVLVLVLWIQSAEQTAAAGVCEVDVGKIPGGEAHCDPFEVAVAGRELKADALDADCPVALALGA
jgi:hypothetical protein